MYANVETESERDSEIVVIEAESNHKFGNAGPCCQETTPRRMRVQETRGAAHEIHTKKWKTTPMNCYNPAVMNDSFRGFHP